jgi:hypothetical protein
MKHILLCKRYLALGWCLWALALSYSFISALLTYNGQCTQFYIGFETPPVDCSLLQYYMNSFRPGFDITITLIGTGVMLVALTLMILSRG